MFEEKKMKKNETYFEPTRRSSAFKFKKITKKHSIQTNSLGEELTGSKISLTDFVNQKKLSNIDFIKIDTDGFDLEAAISGQEIIKKCNVLGFMIETPFVGAGTDTANNFHNIDRFMRLNGFVLFDIHVNRYSRGDLPSLFKYNILAQTEFGQPLWGDIIYLRDAASSDYKKVWSEELSTVKLLKLASLFELFNLPDCSAELLNVHKQQLSSQADVESLLDLLTPPLRGKQLSYKKYVAEFLNHSEKFFPAYESLREKTEKVKSLLRIKSRRIANKLFSQILGN